MKKSLFLVFSLAALLIISLSTEAQIKQGPQDTGSPSSTIKAPHHIWVEGDDGWIFIDNGGDMNDDGILDIQDCFIADRFVSYYLMDGNWDITADLNGDGEITIADANYPSEHTYLRYEEQGHLYDEIIVTSQAEGLYDVSIIFNVWNPNIAGLQYVVRLSDYPYPLSWYSTGYDYNSQQLYPRLLAGRASSSSEGFLHISLYAYHGHYENVCYPLGVYEDANLLFDPDLYGYYDPLGTIKLIDVRAIDNTGNLHLQGDGFTIALSTDAFEVNDVYYRAIGNHVKVLRHPDGYTGKVTIPESFWDGSKRYTVTSIGDYAFYKCSSRNVIIGDSVTSIGNHAFEHSGLSSVTIGKSVKQIGSWAFHDTWFSSVTCKAVTPPSCGYPAFDDIAFLDYEINPTLYVPAESVEAYKSTYPWARFRNIVGIGQVQQGDVDGDGKAGIDDVTALIDYLLSGSLTSFNTDNADCNGDGNVTIDDVTMLIDYLLSGTW